jgi:uncharacterized UBP type Zn finger protein
VQEEKVKTIVEMGFEAAEARRALEAAGWDAEAALNRLLAT